MEDCLFCKIVAGEIPSDKVYEDDLVFAFRDIDPKAPEHVLVVPKKHLASVMDAGGGDAQYLTAMFDAARTIAKDLGLTDKGFRLVINTGEDGGQTVHHLHLHLLGGRAMGWPPG